MTIFLVTSTNPGIEAFDWRKNIEGIKEAFQKTSKLKSFKEVASGIFFVEAKAGTSAADVEDLVAVGSRYTDVYGGRVQNVVIGLDKVATDAFNFYSTVDDTRSSRFSGEPTVKEWLEERFPKQDKASKSPSTKIPPAAKR